MEGNKLLTVLVTITVGIIFVGSLLGPVINEASATEKTFDNTPYGYYDMKPIETDDIWVYSDGSWTYNGELVATNTDGDKVSAVVTNNTTIRQDGMVRSTIYSGSNAETVEAVVVDNTDYISISNVGGNTTNVIYTSGYGVVSDGDYILKKYTTAGYVKGDTPLWVTGFTNLVDSEGNSQVIVHIEGTIDDGLTITITPKKYGTTSDITVGEYTLNYEVDEEGVDLYRITNVTFDVTGTFNGEEYTKTFTYSTFVIPKEVTTELTHHLDAGEIAILAAIPLMAIAALVLLAVRFFAGRD